MTLPWNSCRFDQAAAHTVGGYTGPGDIVSGALAWYGLRGYNAAYAGSPAIDVTDGSGNDLIGVVILPNGSLDIASINTWVTAHTVTTITLKKIYNQAGTGSGLDLLWGGSVGGVTLSLNDNGSLPALNASTSTSILTSSGNIAGQAAPYSFSSVAVRDSGSGTSIMLIDDSPHQIAWHSSANTLKAYMGGVDVLVTAADATRHAVQWVCDQSGGSHIYVDGADNSVNFSGTGTISAAQVQFPAVQIGATVTRQYEAGVWPGAFTPTQAANLTTNQRAYWNF